MNAIMKTITQEYAEYPGEASQLCNIPSSTLRRHGDNGHFEIYYINDKLMVKLDEVIAALTSPEKTIRKTRMRVLAAVDKYSFITANKNDIFGDFNGHLEKLILLVLEEAVWAANHQNEAILKVLITGKMRASHSKNKDEKMVANYLRSLILAEPGWAVPMGKKERRFTVLSPSNAKMQRHDYFEHLAHCIKVGLGALMYYFESYRIGKGGINIRQSLQTEAGDEQKNENLDPFERWLIEEFTFTGSVKCFPLFDNGKQGMEILRSEMRDMYLDWRKEMQIRERALSSKQFGIKLGSYFPQLDDDGQPLHAKNGRATSIFSGSTHTTAGKTYRFPSIVATRKSLAVATGKDISYWENGIDQWEASEDCSTGKPEVSEDDKSKIDAFPTTPVIPPRRK